VLTLVAMICDMSFLHMLNLFAQFVMIYILVLIWKLTNILIISCEKVRVETRHVL
jgi:hypothetical protein